MWEVVSREGRRTRRMSEGIKREEWEEHFMGLLEGVGYMVVRGNERGVREGDGEEGIGRGR